MQPHLARRAEVAVPTCVGPLPRVHPHVSTKVCLLSAAVITEIARKGLLAGVNAYVLLQVALVVRSEVTPWERARSAGRGVSRGGGDDSVEDGGVGDTSW
jgi:hypothetical protein